MALSIKDKETEQLARELAERTGESLTMAMRHALQDRLRRVRNEQRAADLLEDLAAIRRRVKAMPKHDDQRGADEIIGYDENGLPT